MWSGRRRSTSPVGEVDLRSKSGEGLHSIDVGAPLTRRYAPTSRRRGELSRASQVIALYTRNKVLIARRSSIAR